MKKLSTILSILSKPWVLVGCAVLAGSVLRLWQLGSLPVILNRDEAALAYNAWLLSKTGLDEWQRSWPLALQSFGDFKLVGYSWLIIVVSWFFGFSDFAVRLPAALAGTLLIVGVYSLSSYFVPRLQAAVTALLVAVTPVFIFYSRMAWEAEVALLYMCFSLSLFLHGHGFHKARWLWLTDLVAVLLYALAVVTYNTPLLLLPFVVLTVITVRGVKQWQKWWFPVVGLGLIAVFLGSQLLGVATQKKAVTLFGDETLFIEYGAYRQQFSGVLVPLLGNQYLFYSRHIVRNVVHTFSPDFLVWRGGTHPWHQLPTYGHLHLTTYVLGLLGIVITFKRIIEKVKTKHLHSLRESSLLLMLWLMVALAPSVITVDAPHATRSLLFFVIFLMMAAQGAAALYTFLTLRVQRYLKHYSKILIGGLFLVVLALETTHYLYLYFNRYPAQQAAFHPGLPDLIVQTELEYPTQPVAVIDKDGYDYILFAWYLKMPADIFFETIIHQDPNSIGFRYGEKVGRYHFIVNSEDHLPTEQVGIEWDNEHQQWQLRKW